MSDPIDKELYNYVKKLADKKFKSKSGIYKSSWIVKEYKKRGGKYKGKKSNKKGLLRWYKEKWVDLNRPIKDKKGKIIDYEKCGRSNIKKSKKSKQKYPLCRPTYKVTKSTPRTYSQLSKKSILKAKKQKSKVKGSSNIKFGGGRNKKENVCKTCNKTIIGTRELRKHKNLHSTKKSSSKIKCEYCDFKSSNEKRINEHQKKHFSSVNSDEYKKQTDLEKLDDEHFKNLKKYLEEIKQEGSGSHFSQYYGKRSSVMVPVPKNVKKWAEYAFKLKKIGFKGAIETGWKRAHQLSTKEKIPIEDLRYMRNWYARHIYTSYPTFKEWIKAGKPKTSDWFNKRGIQAWITWGANAGYKWVNSDKVINMLNDHFDKNYTKIKIKL